MERQFAPHQAKVIAIMNEKGGVAKSNTATTLAYLLCQRGKKTLLIDFDGQGSATILNGIENPNQLSITISTLLNRVIQDQPLPPPDQYIMQNGNGVDFIPSNSELFVLERNLSAVNFREKKLARIVDELRHLYEYIVIDTMPQIGTPMMNVLMCADSIIIPTQAEFLSIQGLSELLKHHHAMVKDSQRNITIEGILITMDSSQTLVSAHLNAMLEDSFGGQIPIFKSRIPRSIKVAEANLYQKNICEYMPENAAAIAYENFVKELIDNAIAS
ncbi:MAG: ParA family protein [Eubacteriales bacterium]